MAWTPIGTTAMVLLALGAACGSPPAACMAATRPAASREGIERDWMLQDYLRIELPAVLKREVQEWRQAYLRTPESRCDDAVLERMSCFASDHDSYVEQRMLLRVLADLDRVPSDIRAAVDQLVAARTPGNDPRWKQSYLRACELRRSRRLETLLSRWTRFVFDEHVHMGASYKYTECLSDAQSQ